MDNTQIAIVNKAATDPLMTTNAASGNGLLKPYQARQFLTQTFEKATLTPKTRTEMHSEQTGVLPRLTVPERVTRSKTENTPPDEMVTPTFDSIPFAVTPVRVAWSVTNEMFRQNIEGESLEQRLMGLLQEVVALDREDLCINGDTDATGTDDKFLSINDGWLKQIKNGGHVVDGSGFTSLDYYTFVKAKLQMPEKYDSTKFFWIMNPLMKQTYEGYIVNSAVEKGGNIVDARIERPTGIPVLEVPKMPNDCIMLLDPKNLIQVASYRIIIKTINEGWTAGMYDKRGYVVHYDFDAIIENIDATLIIKDLPFDKLIANLENTPGAAKVTG
ncbi:MAG: phage major capsid protein [Muribaculaceae bacterium]|nr:phage major capsid protein [Muribaculaceae bacterium]